MGAGCVEDLLKVVRATVVYSMRMVACAIGIIALRTLVEKDFEY